MSLLLVLVIGVIKALAIVGFGMTLAVLLTWADRRYGALIADRVGPNRAVVFVPRTVAQAGLLLPALAVAGLIIFFFVINKAEGVERTNRALLFSQLAIFATWFTGVVIAGRINARGIRNSFDAFVAWLSGRVIFLIGLAAHILTFVLAAGLRGSAQGRLLREIGYRSGPMLLAAVIVGAAVYAFVSFKNQDKVGIRLAGMLHPAADGLKAIFKEDFIPPEADRAMHSIAPIISFFPALVVLAVVPFGDTLCFEPAKGGLGGLLETVPRDGVCVDGAVKLMGIDINVGILFFFALAGTGIVGAALAGWSSNNKFSLLGGLRAASQMVSYEVTLGLTLIGALMIYGTVRIDEMVRWQGEHAWGIFVQPLAFVLFFAAAIAETKRTPFDLPEGESEIVAGYFTEYSGMKFAMFFFAEYVAIVTSAALMVSMFFGGWHVPFVFRDGIHVAWGNTVLLSQPLSHLTVILIGVGAFVAKTVTLCLLQLTIRWTLPRFRYDQLMRLGWRKLLPVSLLNILATGLVMLALASGGQSVQRGLETLGTLTQYAVVATGLALFVWFVLWVTRTEKYQKVTASSSAQFAAAAGGTKSARMGA